MAMLHFIIITAAAVVASLGASAGQPARVANVMGAISKGKSRWQEALAGVLSAVSAGHHKAPARAPGASAPSSSHSHTHRDDVGSTAMPSLRVCVPALFEYEEHTLHHHLAYHELVGVTSVWVYVDDRDPSRLESNATRSDERYQARMQQRRRGESRWIRELGAWPHVRVIRWSSLGVDVFQTRLLQHCMRETERIKDVEWLASFDGDEYLHIGAPLVSRPPPGAPWAAPDVRTALKAIPQHVLGIILPRLTMVNVLRQDGSTPKVKSQPTSELGQHFFEPQVYDAALLNGSPHGAQLRGPPAKRRVPAPWCRGKPLLRVGHGVYMRVHEVALACAMTAKTMVNDSAAVSKISHPSPSPNTTTTSNEGPASVPSAAAAAQQHSGSTICPSSYPAPLSSLHAVDGCQWAMPGFDQPPCPGLLGTGIAAVASSCVPTGVTWLPSEDALANYSALQLYHFATRSAHECQQKQQDGSKGQLAINTAFNHRNRPPHRTHLPCVWPSKYTVPVYGMAAPAVSCAVNARVAEISI